MKKDFINKSGILPKSPCFDYDNNTETKMFFATLQNKLHLAITGLTAAEIILERVDCIKDNMGLTTWDLQHGIDHQ